MAYLRQQLLEGLRTVGVVNHHFNHGGGWRAPGVSKRRFKFLPVLRTMIFQLEHRGGVLKMDVLRHQIETLALVFRRWQQRENLPAVVVHHN
ncbi:Uncharacterised protein [Escherichia coli]|uniref:Uncharacterized protein n=1 Tax=Escherichia coli TaxID=562 RepID=A0A377D070_ECOLX|nr:Uncharacterised protein [Escherichia coli]